MWILESCVGFSRCFYGRCLGQSAAAAAIDGSEEEEEPSHALSPGEEEPLARALSPGEEERREGSTSRVCGWARVREEDE